MEALNHKYNNFRKCYESLGNVIAVQEELNYIAVANPIADDLFKAGVIKHFELAYETAWKFLKQYLADVYNHEVASPKQVFRACETYRMFPENIVNELIMLADARNTTTHIYDQILAQEVCNSIVSHHLVFGKVIESIKIPMINDISD